MPDPERLQRLFDAALDLPADERAAFVARECGEDAPLRAELERWLAADATLDAFLETPPGLVAQARAENAVDEAPGHFGPWRVLRSLGAGGMGEVWLAERADGEYEQRAAIKQVAYPTPGLLQRFRQERQILARLEHPHIARLIDGGVDARGAPYFAMEYVEGVTITAFARGLDVRATLELFLEVCAAVRFAHQNLVVHRDLKPSNILVGADGAPKLLDFGIAKMLAATDAADAATATGLRLMTPDYAAPEQFRGEAVTTATDVYALGVVLHELLAGVRPQARAGEGAPALPHDDAPPPSAAVAASSADAHARRRALRGDLDRIVLTAIAREPQRRYASIDAFAADIRNHLDGRPVAAVGRSRWYSLRKFVARNRVAVVAAAIALCALIGGFSVALMQAQRASAAAERAERGNDFLIRMIGNADPYYGGKPPLLVDALDRSVAEIPQRLAGQPLLEADIRRAIGQAYAVLNRNDAARTQLDLAAGLRAGEGGNEYAQILQSQAYLEWQLGRYDKAEALYRDALAQCGAGERGRRQCSEVLNDRAGLLNDIGRYDEALRDANEALRLKESLIGVLPRDHAINLSNIGNALDGLGRYDEAYAAYLRALREFEAIAPPPELDIAILLNNLAYLQDEMGRHDEAVKSQERAIALNRKVLGVDQGLTIKLGNLARQYSRLGRHDEAKAAMAEALQLAPQTFDAHDQKLGTVHATAAAVALARGDAREAVAQAQAALAIYARASALEPGRREKAQATLDAALQLAAKTPGG
ncbi:MAG: serine/threonine-protein kinase [Rudaea sp.]|uniref:protein kinase domain-containing protein n=1 Tax=Rudaea sp. TaxID=2136325 RepID=UPI0039E435E3